mgnify:CR=1 FL=1
MKNINIHSVNLTDRNQEVFIKYFKSTGGNFSQWINSIMNEQFKLNEIEALIIQLEELERDKEKIIKKIEEKKREKNVKR